MIKRIYRFVYWYVFQSVIRGEQRKKIIKRKKLNDKIILYRNEFSGKRCFVVATGPSLTINDVELLKGEICFSMNSIIRLFDKTTWRPDFYAIQDKEVYEILKEEIEQNASEFKEIFLGDTVDEYSLPAAYYHLDMQKHLIGNKKTSFSKDIYQQVFDGYTITFSILQLAVYMGFKDIYLLGCDTNYNSGKTHFVEYRKRQKGDDRFYDFAVASYQAAKEYGDAHNIKIINCTRGGNLEVFPRMKLEEVLTGS